MASGWIKLWRKAEENPHLQEADTFGIFCRLLMMASRRDREVFVSKLKRVIRLKRGQLWVSTVDLASMVSSRKRIRTILKSLEMGQLIGQATGQGITIITICNYDRYQDDASGEARDGARGGASEGPGRGQHEQEREEDREEKKIEILCPPASPDGEPEDRTLKKPPERFPKFEALPKNGSARRYPDEFDLFWQAYPKRGSDTKKPAYASWRPKARDPAVGTAMLQEAAERYASWAERTGYETKLVSTWISKEGWTASLEETQANRRNIHGPPKETVLETAAKVLDRARRRAAAESDHEAVAEDQAHSGSGGTAGGDLFAVVDGSLELAGSPDGGGVEPDRRQRGMVASVLDGGRRLAEPDKRHQLRQPPRRC